MFTLILKFRPYLLYLVLISFGTLCLGNHSDSGLVVEIAQFMCSVIEHLYYNMHQSSINKRDMS